MKNKLPLILLFIGLVAVVTYFITIDSKEPTSQQTKESVEELSKPKEKPKEPVFLYGFNKDSIYIIKDKVKPNQNISEILQEYNVSYSEIAKLAEGSREVFDVRKIRANKPYEVICTTDSAHKAKCFIYHPNEIDYVLFNLEDSLSVKLEHKKVVTKEKTFAGVITSSLYNTMVDNGASPVLANALADVYAWQIDFFAIQKGDNFKVLYEEKQVDGKAVGMGRILAAEFEHYGETYMAFYFDQGKESGIEYFDEEGNSLQKTFLKAPLQFSRISSHFSNSRLHPVLKIRRPHHGVDYAAPKGTPVHAVGDGVVIKAQYSGGAGNYVKIKHNSIYTTGYMHLSGYGEGIKVGKTVKQGQIIGYVGSTGLSTGPHLDFRFWKSGHAVDPLKVDPPSAEPVDSNNLEKFNQVKQAYVEKLNKIKLKHVASL